MTKHVIAVVADLHIGSTVALSPPAVTLDEGEYRASKGQRWLWRCWNEYWQDVTEIAEQNGAEITTILNGDITELDTKKRSYQRISQNPAVIFRAAVEVVNVAAKASHRLIFVRGTPAHVGKSGWSEEKLADDFDNSVKDDEGRASWWSLNHEFGGVLLDVEHRGPLGRKPWAKVNPLNTLAVELQLKYSGERRRLPDLAIRSHNHRHADTFDNYPIRVIASPAWQMATEYTHTGGFVESADMGGLIIVADKGHYEVYKRLYKPQARRVWAI